MKIATSTLFDQMSDIKQPTVSGRQKKLQKACKDFEALVLQQLLKTMRESIPKDGLFGNSYAEELYQSMHDQELAQNMADSSKGLGLADFFYQKLVNELNLDTEK